MKKTTILVIDDEKNLLDSIVDLLEINDFTVLAADSGKKALEIIDNKLPDIILCDIMMPTMNGYLFLKELRKNPLAVGIPFIFLSAKSDKKDIRKGMNLSADDYLTKPFTQAELLESIRARINRIEVLKSEIMMFMKNININLVKSGLDSYSEAQEANNEMEALRSLLQTQNKAIEKYCYLNSHKVRGPLCRIMGLLELFNDANEEMNKEILSHLKTSAKDLDQITKEITYAISSMSA
ncbi:response regulator [Flammeovirga kamogawensis]|uniref:Response regulator n=1 Tax=Flammeovirga kamogawensis TaxID=373891 RepID=A0ABX8GWU5_9BACT|nr:response regulator [Flammeovirga kamogawensis]MBB6461111.1 DNA-binding response OmpR family regulator [Flammeovirga kamogawensis]QWG07677.1 response regulator [Flammeovirga kamogawensis]TRX69487.1 response regulator [Flammeovirga kamogawensis]